MASRDLLECSRVWYLFPHRAFRHDPIRSLKSEIDQNATIFDKSERDRDKFGNLIREWFLIQRDKAYLTIMKREERSKLDNSTKRSIFPNYGRFFECFFTISKRYVNFLNAFSRSAKRVSTFLPLFHDRQNVFILFDTLRGNCFDRRCPSRVR
jgi:hypothetical protein